MRSVGVWVAQEESTTPETRAEGMVRDLVKAAMKPETTMTEQTSLFGRCARAPKPTRPRLATCCTILSDSYCTRSAEGPSPHPHNLSPAVPSCRARAQLSPLEAAYGCPLRLK